MDADVTPKHETRNLVSELIPELQEKARELVRRALRAGIPIKITSTFRSWEEQDQLYRQGRERPGERVTNARGGESWHNFRRAFDVAFLGDGRVRFDGPWEELGKLGESLGLEWGGRWKMQDLGHFQLRGGMTTRQARQAELQRRRLEDDRGGEDEGVPEDPPWRGYGYKRPDGEKTDPEF